MKVKILYLFFTFLLVKTTLGYHSNVQKLTAEYEISYKQSHAFSALEKLINLYLIDTRYEEAEKLLLNINESKITADQLGQYYLLLAKTYKYQFKNDLAIVYFNKAEKQLKKLNNKDKLLNYYVELLEFYRKTSDFNRCFKLIDKLQYQEKIESSSNTDLLIFYYNRRAAVLNERARGKESIPYSLKAIQLAKKINDKYSEAISYNELGFSYKNLTDNNKAIEYYEKAANLLMDIACYRDAVHANYNKLIISSHNGLLPHSQEIKLCEKLLVLIDSLQVDYPTSGIYLRIEFHYRHLNKWEMAYRFRLKADSASLLEQNYANLRAMAALKEKFQNEQLEEHNQAIQKLALERKEKLKLAETRFWWIFSFSAFVLLLSVILFILWRKNRIQNKKLEEQNIQKTFLIQEIHHRVKNNLQFVKSILTLQESLNEISASEAIEDINRRIDAVSMVHEMLYIDNLKVNLSIKDYLENLLKVSGALYQSRKKIDYQIEVEPILLSSDHLIGIGIICSELLANSVKHVLAENETLIFSVQLLKRGNQIELTVKDNGKEMKNQGDDKRFKLGMRIIEIFSKKLNATMVINTESNYNFNILFSIE